MENGMLQNFMGGSVHVVECAGILHPAMPLLFQPGDARNACGTSYSQSTQTIPCSVQGVVLMPEKVIVLFYLRPYRSPLSKDLKKVLDHVHAYLHCLGWSMSWKVAPKKFVSTLFHTLRTEISHQLSMPPPSWLGRMRRSKPSFLAQLSW